MRIVVLISTDHYIRQFVTSGAFEAIEAEHDVRYLASDGNVKYGERREILEALPGFAGFIEDPRDVVTGKNVYRRLPGPRRDYKFLRLLLMAGQSGRSRTMRHKLSLMPLQQRIAYRLMALPGLRAFFKRRVLRATGLNAELHAALERERPDLVLAPTGGTDTFLWDGMRSADELGIPVLVLIHNWDNLSSKGLFPVRPDYLGVWGEQSVEHAEDIHGFDRERVFTLGAPQFEHYFRHLPGTTEPPFPFRYALFAGCYAPFDELTPLERLEATIEERALGVKVLYRPHPHRALRERPDFFDETRFRHVVLDPAVRDNYFELLKEYEPGVPRGKPLLPPLDDYPALFEHAEFTICPLSTMIVESAIFETPVIVVAYDDGIHPNSPAHVLSYDHFEGVTEIEGFHVARSLDDVVRKFISWASDGVPQPERPLRDQVGWWLHWDERPYSRRLADLVDEVGRREQIAHAGGLPPDAEGSTEPAVVPPAP